MARSYLDKDLKLLWGLAAARCSHPDCRRELVAPATSADPTAVVGEIGHIVPHSDTGPRADPSYPRELRDRYENLVLLCGFHHGVVDVQPDTYTYEDLRRWKGEHESWVRDRLQSEMLDVGFAELEVVASRLLAVPAEPLTDFTVVPPGEKLRRNHLTSRITEFLNIGYLKRAETEEFIEWEAVRDPDFPERLKAGFVARYSESRESGLSGDALFCDLVGFASGSSRSLERQAAGLAVLVYLFEVCEVFER